MAVTIQFYDRFMEFVGSNLINLASDTFLTELHNNLTFTSTHEQRSEIAASALATGNGYTNPGQSIGAQSWSTVAGTQIFDDDGTDVIWTASGGPIGPATDAVLYEDTSATKRLMCDIDFGASETAGDGTDFRITFNVNGIFRITK